MPSVGHSQGARTGRRLPVTHLPQDTKLAQGSHRQSVGWGSLLSWSPSWPASTTAPSTGYLRTRSSFGGLRGTATQRSGRWGLPEAFPTGGKGRWKENQAGGKEKLELSLSLALLVLGPSLGVQPANLQSEQRAHALSTATLTCQGKAHSCAGSRTGEPEPGPVTSENTRDAQAT